MFNGTTQDLLKPCSVKVRSDSVNGGAQNTDRVEAGNCNRRSGKFSTNVRDMG